MNNLEHITTGQLVLCMVGMFAYGWFFGVWRGEVLERRRQAEKAARMTRARFEGLVEQEDSARSGTAGVFDVLHGENPNFWHGERE